MPLAIAVVIGIALAYAVLLLALWWSQERIVFQPASGIAATRVPARQVRYRAHDGLELFAYVVGDCTPATTAIIAFHGNADLARWIVPWAATVVRETGACVIIPEYRGYDGLGGSPSYAASALDAQATLALVRDTLGVPTSNLVYFGHSLGTAIAAELAAMQVPRVLVLQSPFTSARAMAQRMFLPGLVLFWDIISRVHFDTMRRVQSLDAPVWVTHGDKDFVIPVRMGREVFAAARHKGELLIVHGAGHNDVAEVGGRAYWQWLAHAVGDARGGASASSAPSATPAVRAGTRSAP